MRRGWLLALGCLSVLPVMAAPDALGQAFSAKAQGHDANALPVLEAAAEGGNAKAQTALGEMFEKGEGVSADYRAARDWYTKAAIGGDGIAAERLGELYLNDHAGLRDDALAVQWLARAAAPEVHLASAQYQLSLLYAAGRGVKRDTAQAHRLLEQSGHQQYLPACARLGHDYLEGEGVPKDYARAMDWLRQAAYWDDAFAQYELAHMYDEGLGVARDRMLADALSGWAMRGKDVPADIAAKVQALHARLDGALTAEQRQALAAIAEDSRHVGGINAIDDYTFAQDGSLFAGSDDPMVPHPPALTVAINAQGQLTVDDVPRAELKFLRQTFQADHFSYPRRDVRIVVEGNPGDAAMASTLALVHDEARRFALHVLSDNR